MANDGYAHFVITALNVAWLIVAENCFTMPPAHDIFFVFINLRIRQG
jgi:hypothetical protein